MSQVTDINERRELRRRKILENSEQRLNRLHGTFSKDATSSPSEKVASTVAESALCPDPPDMSLNEVIEASRQSRQASLSMEMDTVSALNSNPFSMLGGHYQPADGITAAGGAAGRTDPAAAAAAVCPAWWRLWRERRVVWSCLLAVLAQLAVLVLPLAWQPQNLLLPFLAVQTCLYLTNIYYLPHSPNIDLLRTVLLMLGVRQADKFILWWRYVSFLVESWCDLCAYLSTIIVTSALIDTLPPT